MVRLILHSWIFTYWLDLVLFFVKNPSSYLAPVWATFAGLSFAVQGPVKSFTDACIFVFSQHPYDVGDWVIWGKEKDLKLIVSEVRLLKTTFTCAESGKIVHIPHTEICTGYIENLSRTKTSLLRSFVLHSEEKLDKCHKEAIDKFREEKLKDLWRSDDKRAIFRYHQFPDISIVPIKSEDLSEKGIRVDFKRKEWVCSSLVSRFVISLANLFRLLVDSSNVRKNVDRK